MSNKMALDALKPCPFCGSDAALEAQFGCEWWVQCNNTECSDAGSPIEPSASEAISRWNRRAAIAALEAEPQPVTTPKN